MAILQSEFPGKTVVIRGMFSHVNFVKDLVPLRLRVIDLIPPSPSKLRYLVDKALSTGMVEFPVIPEYEDIDLNRIDVPEGCGIVMFPCETSGATSELPFCFLDQMPELDPDEKIALVGCNLSKRIFEDRYRNSMSFVNICPRTFVDENIPTIIRCCMIREGCSIEGNIAVLPWGTNTSEVVSAINALFSGRSRFLHGRESSTTKIRSARRPSARSGIIRCFA